MASCLRCSIGLRKPNDILIRASLYQRMDASKAATNSSRLTNAAARLMTVYQDGLVTIQRLRSGGNQTVTVQHVQVNDGGQAVIGNVSPGGKPAGGGS